MSLYDINLINGFMTSSLRKLSFSFHIVNRTLLLLFDIYLSIWEWSKRDEGRRLRWVSEMILLLPSNILLSNIYMHACLYVYIMFYYVKRWKIERFVWSFISLKTISEYLLKLYNNYSKTLLKVYFQVGCLFSNDTKANNCSRKKWFSNSFILDKHIIVVHILRRH